MRRAFLLVGVVLSAACSRPDPGEVTPSGSPVYVEVKSTYGLPMEIYASGAGGQQRLGMVHPGMSATFVVPQPLVGAGGVEFQARPTAAGSPTFRSGPLLLAPGSVVDLILKPQLFSSTASIRP